MGQVLGGTAFHQRVSVDPLSIVMGLCQQSFLNWAQVGLGVVLGVLGHYPWQQGIKVAPERGNVLRR
jgi:hypothetical protein